jgi:TRAP-type mannitol/chloroaromatic compound transport system substrate-binding protein
VNLAKWDELPKTYQAILEAAAAKAHPAMLSKYDAQNPKALRELTASGTKLTPFSMGHTAGRSPTLRDARLRRAPQG